MVGQYVLEAMEKFLTDNGVEYDELTSSDTIINVKWISSSITYEVMNNFEFEFAVSLQSYEIDDGKLIDVEFMIVGE